MSLTRLPGMLLHETDGWPELVRAHPSVKTLLLFFVAPMSLIPALMYAYAELVQPGSVFPLVHPQLSVSEAVVVGALFVVVELAMVLLMAIFIQRTGESAGAVVPYENAFTLAAIAPTPLWLSSLALFVPSLPVNVIVVAIAWIGSAALIRHGVRPVIGLHDAANARSMAFTVTLIGVGAWIALMIILGLLISLVLGLR